MQIIIVIIALAMAAFAGSLAAGGHPEGMLAGFAAVVAVLLALLAPKSALLLLVFSMLLSPELGLAGVSGTSRSVVVRYDDILLIVIFMAWFAKTAILKGKPLVFRSPVQMPILVFTAMCVISTSFAVVGGHVRWDVAVFYVLKYGEYFLLYFMVFNIIETKEEMRGYFKAGAVVAAIVTVYAVWYYFNAGSGARASTPFEAPVGSPEESEPASLGGYYLIIFGLLFGVISEMPFRNFAWAFGALVFMLPAFILSLSRASYLGLAFSGMAAVFLSGQRRLFLLGAAAVGVIAMMMTPYLSEMARGRVQETYAASYAIHSFSTPFGDIKLEESAALRVRAWQRGFFHWLPKNVLIGNGVTGTGMVDAQVPLVVGETGILGLAAWLWMIGVCFKVAWRLYKRSADPSVRAIALGYVIGLFGLLWQSVGVNTFIIVRIMEPFWFLTAIIMKLNQLEEEHAGAS